MHSYQRMPPSHLPSFFVSHRAFTWWSTATKCLLHGLSTHASGSNNQLPQVKPVPGGGARHVPGLEEVELQKLLAAPRTSTQHFALVQTVRLPPLLSGGNMIVLRHLIYPIQRRWRLGVPVCACLRAFEPHFACRLLTQAALHAMCFCLASW